MQAYRERCGCERGEGSVRHRLCGGGRREKKGRQDRGRAARLGRVLFLKERVDLDLGFFPSVLAYQSRCL